MDFQDNTILTPDNLALVTDPTSGFSQDQAEDLGFDVVGIPVNIFYADGESDFLGGNDLNDEFYARLSDSKITGAKTSSNVGSFLEVFKHRLSEGKLVIYLGVTDSLSSGMGNAALTAQDTIREENPELNADNILALPTHCIAGGLGLGLRILRDWLDAEPRTLDELKLKVEDIANHMAHIFTLFSYEFMKKSGRFSSKTDQLKIALAKTLKIYPVMLSPRKGPLQPTWQKVRGNKNLLERFADIYAETAQDPETGVVEIDYSGVSDDSNTAFVRVHELKELLKQRFPEAEIRIERTAPSVGCHVGPDEMSMFFLQKEVRPDILD